jgi:hypothetical protein
MSIAYLLKCFNTGWSFRVEDTTNFVHPRPFLMVDMTAQVFAGAVEVEENGKGHFLKLIDHASTNLWSLLWDVI